MQNSVCYQLRNSEVLFPSLKQTSKIEVSKRTQPNFSSNHNRIEFSRRQPTNPLNHIKTARISNFFHDVYHCLKANSYKNPPHPLAPRDLGTMASMLEKWWFHSEMQGLWWVNDQTMLALVSWSPYFRDKSRRDFQMYHYQWIGLRENLQETKDFPIQYGGFL